MLYIQYTKMLKVKYTDVCNFEMNQNKNGLMEKWLIITKHMHTLIVEFK